MNLESIDQWFSSEQQRNYISVLRGRVGLTRRRAECFVRLWAYLLLKRQQELNNPVRQFLTELYPLDGFVACTHREAAELFYANNDRGSDRAAGMMLDQLVALGLIEKQFDGNTISIRVSSLPNLSESPKPVKLAELKSDAFNPRTDAIPVASFLARIYKWMNKNNAAPNKIARLLRHWAERYPTGMRVLRHCDTLNPVGFHVLHPIARESEKNFFLPPSKSLHISSASDIDPITLAALGDADCTCVFVRSWIIDTPYMQQTHVCQFLEDTQQTLVRMQADFPNLCDLYALSIHPTYEALALALGFQQTGSVPQLPVYWMYKAVDQFLALDIKQAVSRLEFSTVPPEPEVMGQKQGVGSRG